MVGITENAKVSYHDDVLLVNKGTCAQIALENLNLRQLEEGLCLALRSKVLWGKKNCKGRFARLSSLV